MSNDKKCKRCESYKTAYDTVLADLRVIEQKLNDIIVENARLIRLGEERHVKHKNTEEHLMALEAKLRARVAELDAELAKSRAERNEYFVALSKIANNPVYGVEVIELVTIAKAALRRNGE